MPVCMLRPCADASVRLSILKVKTFEEIVLNALARLRVGSQDYRLQLFEKARAHQMFNRIPLDLQLAYDVEDTCALAGLGKLKGALDRRNVGVH